ncbi:MobQ family relaxase [Ruminococcus sp.]|uniref:MobQ family relaxase n=1 Tax=Ruminococcus sp. TaxID=41978 RepID=UPI00260084A6|nr:MobQ family relaxase [Ruminococcus sp.]MBR1433314.1 MobA/MobL family protein [Ruminococcus sp.]
MSIAIYHFSVKIVSRSAGASCVAKAAYIAGEKIKNERDRVTHDYRRKHEVVHKEILLPAGAPEQFRERAVLWNAAEKKETRKNSQTARSIDAALPRELFWDEQIDLVRNFVAQNFTSKGMCADFTIHDKQDGNPHVHILLTTRRVDADGFTTKDRSWNDRAMLEQWRASWADWCNHKLYFVSDERIDHRSYADQGIDKIPTVHLGAGVCAIEKKGKKTDRGLLNLQIEIENTSNALTSMRQEMENNRKFISEQKEQHCQEYFGCSLSEICHVIEKDDYISYLAEEMRKRNENTLLAKIDDDRTRMTIAKRNTEMLDKIMDEMHNASVYVHEHKLYPSGWSNIMRTYNELRQQEEQEKQKSEPTPAEPKKDKPAKSTGLRHH